MATLAGVIDQLQVNREENSKSLQSVNLGIDRLNFQMKSFLDAFKMQQLDMLETLREQKKATEQAQQSGSGGGSGGFKFPALAIGLNIPTLIAGLTAVAGAFAGLRGWEGMALKNIDKIGKSLKALIPTSLIKTIDQKFINVRARIMRNFGLDPSLGAKDADGKRTLRTPLTDQIRGRFNSLRVDILRRFGIGADGKAIVTQGADGKFRVPLVGAVMARIRDIFSPVQKFATGVIDFIGGAGKGLFGFLKTFGLFSGVGAIAGKAGGAVAGVAKLAGKILLPLGILFSAFDAFEAWKNAPENATFTEKMTAASFAFLGDFFGAPLDLLKGGFVWLMKKIFGIETDENGKIKEGQGIGGEALRILDEFSFEDTIKAIPNAIYAIVDSIAAFFNDPIGVGKQVIGNIYESVKGMFLSILRSIVSAIPGGKSLFPGLFETQFDADIERREGMQGELRQQLQARQFDVSAAQNNARIFGYQLDGTRNEIAELEEYIATKNYRGGDGTAGWGRTRAAMEEDLAEAKAELARLERLESENAQRLSKGQRDVFRIGEGISINNRELEALRAQRDAALNITTINTDNSTNVEGGTTVIQDGNVPTPVID